MTRWLLAFALLAPLPATPTNGWPPVREYVNALPYNLHDPEPALQAYALVALDIGWSPQKIHDWRRFANAVIKKESGYCPNPRGGARWKDRGRGCVLSRQGDGDDVGFGQVTWRYFYAEGRPLCANHGLCSGDLIISEPYLSMAAMLWTIDNSGSYPWCYTAAQVNHPTFACVFAPDNPHYFDNDHVIQPTDGG